MGEQRRVYPPRHRAGHDRAAAVDHDCLRQGSTWHRPGQAGGAHRTTVPSAETISSVSQYGKVDQGIQLLDAADLAISILAVGIGAIGVMNTMIMSVFERTREIGILRAVGWSRWRIMGMILSEAAMLCAAATAIGIGLGLAATWAVTLEPTIGKVLQPTFGFGVVQRALIVAAIVPLVGAAYPAARAIRLTPMEALRHE